MTRPSCSRAFLLLYKFTALRTFDDRLRVLSFDWDALAQDELKVDRQTGGTAAMAFVERKDAFLDFFTDRLFIRI